MTENKLPVFYACINKNEASRNCSSSGGVFTLLAERVIAENGAVFAARFNSDFEVIHDCCEEISELKFFLGSKYVQSKMNGVYSYVKSKLSEGKKVLFCGTPCQVSALKAYLGCEHADLLTVDFVCHGVPSPKIWKDYLRKIANGREISNINFRDKTEGWRRFSLKIQFTNGDEYRAMHREDTFMKGFLQNIYLRPSCYECAFKGLESEADITLADFWRAQEFVPSLYDDKGTSLIIVNSQKGIEAWNRIEDKMCFERSDEATALAVNSSILHSAPRPAKRDTFFTDKETDIVVRIEKTVKIGMMQRVKGKLKSVFSSIKG
ncbi:MAG: Coenzyme F420 hydrogenase/dehydrogenase, beta subunit C-terminal domain [Clostridia bacterium]|nr:Coenzyme F420 hydrogenase/dehydrogenase, beta subunit C-terminal domain [Clostridia bacterium]